MRKFPVMLLLAAALPAWAAAQFVSAEDLYAGLASKDGQRRAYARGYVMAVVDVGASSTIHNRIFCVPREAKAEAVAEAVGAWFREHAKELKHPAEELVARALEDSYHCGPKP